MADVLTESQTLALERTTRFLADTAPVAEPLFLDGRAGTGKTYLTAKIVKIRTDTNRPVVVLAPTHKALGVLRGKLKAAKLNVIEIIEAKNGLKKNGVYLATLASWLGIAPAILEEQDEKLQFVKSRDGTSRHFKNVRGLLIVMDETSMLAVGGYGLLIECTEKLVAQLILVGDTGQLPPVKAVPAPLNDIDARFTLEETVRQQADSAIVSLAGRIRANESIDWVRESGGEIETWPDCTRHDFILGFLKTIKVPSEVPEEEQSVYIAYRNKVVDGVNQLACEACYGHTSDEFRAGERVVAGTAISLWDPALRREVTLAHVSEPLEVVGFGTAKGSVACDITGDTFEANHIRLRGLSATVSRRMLFDAWYIPPALLANTDHPWNVELRAKLSLAKSLQVQYAEAKKGGKLVSEVNMRRKDAWVDFFRWQGRTLANITHPFAITCHKSQGSTYEQVFCDVADIRSVPGSRNGIQRRALYVAVTRARLKVDLLV